MLERAGNSDVGPITAFYTVLVAGDDMNEPVADEVRSILDGHIILSRELAGQGHYPAINCLDSVSRLMAVVASTEHRALAAKLREVLAIYEKNKDLIVIGAYVKGSDARVDHAIAVIERVNAFLKQATGEKAAFEDSIRRLKALVA